jgi:hypothetical protein
MSDGSPRPSKGRRVQEYEALPPLPDFQQSSDEIDTANTDQHAVSQIS